MNDDASPCNAHNFGIQQKKLFQIHPAALFPCAAMPRCRQGDAVRWAAARGRRILTLGEREVVSLLLGSNFLVEPLSMGVSTQWGARF